jgi:hypothetical protein
MCSCHVRTGHLVSYPCTGRFSPFFLASHKANTLPTWHQSEFFYLQSYSFIYSINLLSSAVSTFSQFDLVSILFFFSSAFPICPFKSSFSNTKMPRPASNTFCSFSCFLEVAEPPVFSDNTTSLLAYMYGTEFSDIPVLSRPDLFTAQVNFYNPSGTDFPVSSVCFCQGTLTALECGSLLPVLTIRASSLITYYAVSASYLLFF